mmetsp:Transcript_8468/g.23321  ORF Transcript_8468/g.23321 Transcript_8468/m.23321 type:complete len:304 (+) Transcript_8468:641-1552(+)
MAAWGANSSSSSRPSRASTSQKVQACASGLSRRRAMWSVDVRTASLRPSTAWRARSARVRPSLSSACTGGTSVTWREGASSSCAHAQFARGAFLGAALAPAMSVGVDSAGTGSPSSSSSLTRVDPPHGAVEARACTTASSSSPRLAPRPASHASTRARARRSIALSVRPPGCGLCSAAASVPAAAASGGGAECPPSPCAPSLGWKNSAVTVAPGKWAMAPRQCSDSRKKVWSSTRFASTSPPSPCTFRPRWAAPRPRTRAQHTASSSCPKRAGMTRCMRIRECSACGSLRSVAASLRRDDASG